METSSDSVELVGDETTKNIARAVLFAAVTSATAPMTIVHPLVPNVPITLQTLWVLLAGVFLGPIWGPATFLLYLCAGVVGLPVFAGGSAGLGVLTGPTSGFLLSYPFAAAAIGLAVHGFDGLRGPKDVAVSRLVAGLVAGLAVVYVVGALGFAFAQHLGPVAAVVAVVIPFLPVALVKLVAAVAVVRSDGIVAR